MTFERVEAVLALGEDEVQVWRVSAMQASSVLDACRAMLSVEELKRVERTRAGLARQEFVVGRALLRVLVARALGCTAAAVKFEVGEHGKPWVDGVNFNVSHSRGMVLVALCRGAAVGVDVEAIDDAIEAVEIAEGSFARDEVARIRAVEGAERVRAFYSIWTRKEAVTKAHGHGLTMELAGFSVVDGADVVRLPGQGPVGEAYYTVEALPMSDEFAGALAVQREARAVRCLELTGAGLMDAMH